MKRLVQAITFYVLLPWLYLIALMPFWLLYRISDLSFCFVYYVFKYRRKITWTNLSHAFPTAAPYTLQKLEKSFYKHLCDLLLEYIKSLTMSPSQIARRSTIQNPELLQSLYAAGSHILLVTGHHGNWEWAAHAIPLQTSYTLYVVYKPLSNPYFDNLVCRIRKRFGRGILPENQVLRTMLRYDATPKATALLADQAPDPQHGYVMNFLNQPTYVAQGVEKLAKKLNQMVVYIHIRKIKRGYYNIVAELLFDDPSNTPPHTITQTYTQSLEKDISQQPTTWLWSHRRWKNRPSAE